MTADNALALANDLRPLADMVADGDDRTRLLVPVHCAVADGALLEEDGIEWEWVVDTDDEGDTRGWWTCGRCGGTATGDDSRARHTCRTTCAQCDKQLVWMRVAPVAASPFVWVTDAGEDSTAHCDGSDDNQHVPECDQ